MRTRKTCFVCEPSSLPRWKVKGMQHGILIVVATSVAGMIAV